MFGLQRLYHLCFQILLGIGITRTEAFSMATPKRFVGFDLGTSGARISVIEKSATTASGFQEVYSQAIPWDDKYDDAATWLTTVEELIFGASKGLGNLESVASICVSGTSASCLVIDRNTQEVTRPARMYNYDVLASRSINNDDDGAVYGAQAVKILEKHAPPRHTARASTGSIAKLLAWAAQEPWRESEVLCHQSDFISMKLMCDSTPVKSDWHNCLKCGYDVRNKQWPEWIVSCLEDVGISNPLNSEMGVIPLSVVSPGEPMGTVDPAVCKRLGLPNNVVVVGGTTDSNAAFFAAAGTQPPFGTAVTSLGSTLAMKQLSQTYVEDADRGVYSHRFPTFSDDMDEAWLVGGASNVGCAILRKLDFSTEELDSLSAEIDYRDDSPLSYYPLTKKGERFPIADSNKEPLLEPVPDSRKEFLHGILQSISDVERDGFVALRDLGAPPPTMVWTCGGGSRNDMWSRMRERRLSSTFGGSGVSVQRAQCTEASFGAALLAAGLQLFGRSALSWK